MQFCPSNWNHLCAVPVRNSGILFNLSFSLQQQEFASDSNCSRNLITFCGSEPSKDSNLGALWADELLRTKSLTKFCTSFLDIISSRPDTARLFCSNTTLIRYLHLLQILDLVSDIHLNKDLCLLFLTHLSNELSLFFSFLINGFFSIDECFSFHSFFWGEFLSIPAFVRLFFSWPRPMDHSPPSQLKIISFFPTVTVPHSQPVFQLIGTDYTAQLISYTLDYFLIDFIISTWQFWMFMSQSAWLLITLLYSSSFFVNCGMPQSNFTPGWVAQSS